MVIITLIVCTFLIGYTQVPTPKAPTPTGITGQELLGVEAPIISEKYILMPGDNLLITVTGKITYSYSAWVTYEGKITVNMPVTVTEEGKKPYYEVIDAVKISGLSLKSAQDSLTSIFGKYFKEVKIKLTLTGMRSGIVFVTGEVENPGAYNASPVERVSQIINKAGGISPLGSKSKIKLIRQGQEFALADIERFETTGDLSANPFVESGDIIYVPAVSGIVTVKGAVFGRGQYKLRVSALTTEKERVSEGIYELRPGERVFDLISKAGGITPWADLKASYVERLVVGGKEPEKIPIDLQKIILEKDEASNIELKNADILVVPPINTLVYVEGEVNKPGPFIFTPSLRVSDYIGQAGGPTAVANLRRVFITRADKRISARNNPIVEPSDKIFVPRQTMKWWQDYLQIGSSVVVPIIIAILYVYLSK